MNGNLFSHKTPQTEVESQVRRPLRPGNGLTMANPSSRLLLIKECFQLIVEEWKHSIMMMKSFGFSLISYIFHATIYIVFNTNLLHAVNRSDMFRPQLLHIFRELASFSTCAACMSCHVTEFCIYV